MSLWLLGLLLALGSASATTTGQLTGGKASEHPEWFKESFLDIAEDVAEATEQDRHVMLFLHLNNCPYCYRMVEENIRHAPYTDFIRAHFDVIALNIRGDREVAFNEQITLTEKQLAERLRVNYTPTVIFLDRDNRPVARINGYRSVDEFKQILDYVQQQAYRTESLDTYLDARKTQRYVFRDHPAIVESDNLQQFAERPLAVLFEDESCSDCDRLHDGYLNEPEVLAILERLTLVRLDALSDAELIDVDGRRTTPRAYAAELGLTYRPGIVLFDQGREIARIESELYRYHFTELLRYVGERHYLRYPDSFYDYLDVRTAELLASGQDIDLSE
jgi:thioredoxin-related protein